MCVLYHLPAIKIQNISPFTQIFVHLLLHPLTTAWSPPPINRGRAPTGLFPPSGPFSVILSFPAIWTFLIHPNLYKLSSLFSSIHFLPVFQTFFYPLLFSPLLPMPKPPLNSNPTAQKTFRQHLRKHGTVAEAVLWRILEDRQIEGVKFRRQFGVGNYVLDFYAPDLKLAIELDGGGHYTLEGDAYDVTRTQVLFHDYGIRILRFENREVLQELQRVIYEITEVVKKIQRGEEFVCRSWR